MLQQLQRGHAVLSSAVYVESIRNIAAGTVPHEFLQRCARNVSRRQVRRERVPSSVETAPSKRPQNRLEDYAIEIVHIERPALGTAEDRTFPFSDGLQEEQLLESPVRQVLISRTIARFQSGLVAVLRARAVFSIAC